MNVPFSRSVLTALFWVAASVPLAGCAPETTFCEADGAKYYVQGGGVNVYVNPVLFSRIYGSENLEYTVVYSILNNGTLLPPTPTTPTTYVIMGGTEPGGTYICARPRTMESARTGFGPFPFARTDRFSLSVRAVMTDSTGRVQTFTLPVTRYKTLEEDMPGFTCGSTHCGR
jgi:hypothetical protein